MFAKLLNQLRAIRKFNQLFPSSPSPVEGDDPRWTNTQLNDFARKLFKEGYVVIPNFLPTKHCKLCEDEITSQLDLAGCVKLCRELQTNGSIEQPEDDDINGSRIIYRASASRGHSYDTGMLIVAKPECMVQRLTELKDDPAVSKIIAAAKNGTAKYKGQTVYFNDSVSNPRGLHWDSLAMQYKAFLYLSDVGDIADGPYSYVGRTHGVVTSRLINASINQASGSNSSDAPIYNPFAHKRLLGARGTLIISNQRGYHGGTPQQPGRRRIMIVQNYI